MAAVLTALILMVSTHHSDSRWKVVQPYNQKLERIARCEWGYKTPSWFGATGNGYYGGLQFDLQTWTSVGGKGYPHQNSKLEQKFRAVKLIRKRGYRPWPNCGSA
jgi:hypothetical protein